MSKIVPDPPFPPLFVTHPDLSLEDAMASICALLRCAASTATESAEALTHAHRDMACATAYLIDMAQTLSERVLDCLQPRK
ncbi:DUF6124 family protein [Pseudomonas mucidolens]|uniref:DUF6124 family protein n=1 Tax=Pseudomonas mucidolens TaxID=46679 RepID=UPI0030D8315B